ncbi:MAG: QueT transporter family protein, partial [Oscillospiraceae bacterium]|nr:QueT transporter family protein [Oscillospiraceae bacterium]
MKNNSKNETSNLSKQAMIAAIYTVLSLALSAISYGPFQIRISEA